MPREGPRRRLPPPPADPAVCTAPGPPGRAYPPRPRHRPTVGRVPPHAVRCQSVGFTTVSLAARGRALVAMAPVSIEGPPLPYRGSCGPWLTSPHPVDITVLGSISVQSASPDRAFDPPEMTALGTWAAPYPPTAVISAPGRYPRGYHQGGLAPTWCQMVSIMCIIGSPWGPSRPPKRGHVELILNSTAIDAPRWGSRQRGAGSRAHRQRAAVGNFSRRVAFGNRPYRGEPPRHVVTPLWDRPEAHNGVTLPCSRWRLCRTSVGRRHNSPHEEGAGQRPHM